MKTAALLSLSLVCFSQFVLASPNGGEGEQGQSGTAGHAGGNGSIGGLQEMYAWYPLCSLASLIAAAHDETKLSEYLRAGCSVSDIATHTRASMFTYTVTRQEPELLTLIVADSKAKAEIDVFAVVPNVDALENLPVALNPFEVTIYNRLIDRNSPENFPRRQFKDLYVDESQVSMLKLLLAFANDAAKLKAATATALQNLEQSEYASHSNLVGAISLIEKRIDELSGVVSSK